MKKLLTLLSALAISTGVMAQQDNSVESDPPAEMQDSMSQDKGTQGVQSPGTHNQGMQKSQMMNNEYMMKDGKMMMMKDGKKMTMDKEMTLSNGMMVYPSGMVKMKDGKTMYLKNGEKIDMNGKMTDMNGKMMKMDR